jgi:hypothetical protein
MARPGKCCWCRGYIAYEKHAAFSSQILQDQISMSPTMQCYGVGTAEPYKAEQLQQLTSKLKTAIRQQRSSSSKFSQRRG